jgi:hypothetical protein
MGEVVNLRRVRKLKARDADQKQAAENRAKFGQTKLEKDKIALEALRAAQHHDGHKRET